MTSLVAIVTFVGFIAVGVWLVVATARAVTDEQKQRFTSVLLLYVVVVTGTAGATGRDLWPFSAWQLVVDLAPEAVGDAPDAQSLLIRAFDATGVDHAVDYRAWQPLSVEDLSTWLVTSFSDLDPSHQEVVGAHLLARAEEGRLQALSGQTPGVSDRIFGPFSAPFHLLHPRRWSDPDAVPTEPFTGIRFYREYFDLEEVALGASVRLGLVYEYRSDGS